MKNLIFALLVSSVCQAQTYVKGNNLVEVPTTITDTGGTTTLTNVSQTNNQFTGTTGQSVNLTNATTIAPGTRYWLSNRDSQPVTVLLNDGTTVLKVLPAGCQGKFLLLTNGTTNGTWDTNFLCSNILTSTGILGGPIVSAGTISVDVGTAANKIIQLTTGAQYPAVDGFLITNVNRVASLVARTGLTGGTITSSGTISVDVGTTANKIVQLATSAQYPAIDGNLITNVNASFISGFGIATTSPTSAQILTWNSSANAWSPQAFSVSSSGVSGAVQFSNGSGGFSSDATNFFWDSTNHRLGIQTNAPSSALTVSGAGTLIKGTASSGGAVFELDAATGQSFQLVAQSGASAFGTLSSDPFSIKTNNTNRLSIDTSGHFIYLGTAPAIGSCGTSPSIAGNDNVGVATVGTGGVAMSCTITFASTWSPNAPVCVVSDDSSALNVTPSSTTSQLVITAATPFGANDKLSYHCFGYQ